MTDSYNSELLAQLRSPEVAERREAVDRIWVMTLDDYPDPPEDISHLIPDIAHALTDEDAGVREYALKAIGSAQLDGQNVSAAIPAVIDLLFNGVEQNESIRKAAAYIVNDAVTGGFDVGLQVAELMQLLTDGQGRVKWAASVSLPRYFATTGQWDAVASLLAHSDPDVREEAAATLANLPDQVDLSPAVPSLISLLSDTAKKVRLMSARTLVCSVRSTPPCVDYSPAIPVLIASLDDQEVDVRSSAASAIYSLLLDVLHPEQNTKQRNSFSASGQEALADAVTALYPLVGDNREPIRDNMMGSESDKRVVRYAVQTVAQFLVHHQEFEELAQLFEQLDPDMKAVLLETLPCANEVGCDIDISEMFPMLVDLAGRRIPKQRGNTKNLRIKVNALWALVAFVELSKVPPRRNRERARRVHEIIDASTITRASKADMHAYIDTSMHRAVSANTRRKRN